MNPDQLPLKDIHLPEAIGWWPPAAGWLILAVLIPMLVVFLVWLYKKLTRKTAIKTAIKTLREIKLDTENDDFSKLCKLSVLFRRTAISIYPREETAGLTGEEWLTFLEHPMQDKRFTEREGRLLLNGPYQNPKGNALQIDKLIKLFEDWIKAASRSRK